MKRFNNKSNFPKEPTYVENLFDLTGLHYIIVGHLRNQYGPELKLYENGIIENTKTHEQFYLKKMHMAIKVAQSKVATIAMYLRLTKAGSICLNGVQEIILYVK